MLPVFLDCPFFFYCEKFGELYDNEWTDAIDSKVEVKALYPDMETAEIEEVIIRHLYQLVMVSLLL
jgi:hypothetical protein